MPTHLQAHLQFSYTQTQAKTAKELASNPKRKLFFKSPALLKFLKPDSAQPTR